MEPKYGKPIAVPRAARRLVEGALIASAMVAGGLLFRSVAWGAGEPINCANNTCIAIQYYRIWPPVGNAGGAFQFIDCLLCSTGRCQNGSAVTCTQTINPQWYAAIDVNGGCDCNRAPAHGWVQANGSWNGPWKPSTVNQYCCPGQPGDTCLR